jgi:hypothetical protein
MQYEVQASSSSSNKHRDKFLKISRLIQEISGVSVRIILAILR